MAPVIHFVNETGLVDKVPSKQRLSRINAHVARFAHDRRKKSNKDTVQVTQVSNNQSRYSRMPLRMLGH